MKKYRFSRTDTLADHLRNSMALAHGVAQSGRSVQTIRRHDLNADTQLTNDTHGLAV